MPEPLDSEVFHEAFDFDHPPAFIGPLEGPGIDEDTVVAADVAAERVESSISCATVMASGNGSTSGAAGEGVAASGSAEAARRLSIIISLATPSATLSR